MEALAEELPETHVQGIAAGLHATVELPEHDDEEAIREEARRCRIQLATMGDYRLDGASGPPTLMLGYAQIAEPAIRPGVRALAKAVRAARRAG